VINSLTILCSFCGVFLAIGTIRAVGLFMESRYIAEKKRRVFYQDIVYDVCNQLDRYRGKTKIGERLLVGGPEEPTGDVQLALSEILDEAAGLRRQRR
jgi:hypothetical protein